MSINLAVKISGNIDPLLTSLRKAERSMNKFSKQMTRVGSNLTRSLTLPIAGLGFLAVKTFADFEQSMAKVKAISGATGIEFKNLEKSALDLGASTRYTAAQISELQLEYAKLGFVPSEITKITGATLDLALATGEDLSASAGVAGATLRAFGMDSSEMGRVVDVVAESLNKAALDLDGFRLGMAPVAPVAKALGYSLEQTSAMLSVLSNVGIEASTSGTMLRNMMLKATKDGFSFEEALAKIAGSSNQAAEAMKYFDTRAVPVAIALANNKTSLDSLTVAYQNSAGATKKAASIMDNTLTGSLLRMKSAAEGMAIAFGEVLSPAIDSIAKGLAGIATWFKELSPATKKLITIIATLTATIGPLLFIIGKIPGIFASMIGGVVGLVGQLKNLALFLVANPWILVAAGIAIAATALIRYAVAAKSAKEKQIELNNVINAARDSRNAQLVDEYKALGANKELQDKFYNGWKDAWWGYVNQARKAQAAGNKDAAEHAWLQADYTHELIDQLDKVRGAGKGIEEIAPAFDVVTTATYKASTSLQAYIDMMKMLQSGEFVGPIMPKNFGAVQSGPSITPMQPIAAPQLGTGIDLIIQKVQSLTEKIGVFKDAFNSIADGLGGIFARVKGLFGNIADFAKQAADKFKDGWKAAAASVLQAISGVVGMIGDIMNDSHQKDLDRLNEADEAERERIQNSIMSEDQKAEALAKLDKDSEKKRKAIAREQAKDAKTVAIIQAAIAGALAVVMALGSLPGPAGIVMAVIVGALAAIQIAAIAAQPLPALAQGGLAYAPTMAMVGDNPNAMIDPEVIAPLSKLRQFMGGEGRAVAVYGVLRGEDILLSSERAGDSRERTRGY